MARDAACWWHCPSVTVAVIVAVGVRERVLAIGRVLDGDRACACGTAI